MTNGYEEGFHPRGDMAKRHLGANPRTARKNPGQGHLAYTTRTLVYTKV